MLDLANYETINQGAQHHSRTSRYSLIPTTRVINVLESLGWNPVQVAEVKCRKQDKRGFQKHMIRFQNPAMPVIKGNNIPEIVLTNSHDGGASFCIMAGIIRLICSNGLLIADSTFNSHKIRHTGYTDEAVRLAVEDVSDNVPKIAARVNEFQTIDLTPDERGIFAQAALVAKYGEEETQKREFLPECLLDAYRIDDQAPTLWNTFNVVQEKLIKGGRFERKTNNRYGLKKTRGTKNISENVRINQALWMLTEQMANIKKAA